MKWKREITVLIVVEVIVVLVLIAIGLGIWCFASTSDERAADAQFDRLVKFANRQQVEIAVIKQAAELQQLKQAIARAQAADKQRMQKLIESAAPTPIEDANVN